MDLPLSGANLSLPPAGHVTGLPRGLGPGTRCDRAGGGALLSKRGRLPWHQPAVPTRPVVSTDGAGDALLAAFVRAYCGGLGAREAPRLACTFASWKCGELDGAAPHPA
ncbi:PfkB family carbohydrate kinase [Deinococcus apachensis]|uniref:PfkB family carbohydrate kinase n=1 Tax=Deinococcus apachensis TaxID=309886 RepID=UPI002480BCD6|nr:PfkB family carbohydrate kinase [Deinococcus apachensis]